MGEPFTLIHGSHKENRTETPLAYRPVRRVVRGPYGTLARVSFNCAAVQQQEWRHCVERVVVQHDGTVCLFIYNL
jgi:hypothetical protein